MRSKHWSRRLRLLAAACVACSIVTPLSLDHVAAADERFIALAATRADGTTEDERSRFPDVSADGSQLAFTSEASLDPADSDHREDIYVKNLATGELTLVSMNALGVKGDRSSRAPSLSANGTKVAFATDATNLEPLDTNGVSDIYVKDLVTGALHLVSVTSTGAPGTSPSSDPSLSADGTKVAFTTRSRLVETDTNDREDIYVKDLRTGSLTHASVGVLGAIADGDSRAPSLSADGSKVAFETTAKNLHISDGDADPDILVKNLATGDVALASRTADLQSGNGASTAPSLSADGNVVAFESLATDLHPLDTDELRDVYVTSFTDGTVTVVSTNPAGAKGDRRSISPALAGDGRSVAFVSRARNLHPLAPRINVDHVFLKRLDTGAVELLTIAPGAVLANDNANRASVSLDGEVVAIETFADNLDPRDTDPFEEVYVWPHTAIAAPRPSDPADPVPGAPGVPTGAVVESLVPARLLDTRAGASTVDGRFAGSGRLPSGRVLRLRVAGRGGVPTGASAVVLNVTAVAPDQAGWVVVFPCTAKVPTASNINYAAGEVVANAVVAKLAASGEVCVLSSAATDLVVDVNGYVPAVTGGVVTLNPARLSDTRAGAPTVDGQQAGGGRLRPGRVMRVQVAGRGGVPRGAAAAVLNLTAVAPDQAGWMVVFPCTAKVPTASNVNYAAGEVVANAVVVKLTESGEACVVSSATADVVIDVNGHVPLADAMVTLTPARLLDTRTGGVTVDGKATGAGATTAGGVVRLRVAGRGGVPADAVAAVLNVTAVEPADAGWVAVYPCTAKVPLASNVNYVAGDVVANAVVAKLSPTGEVCLLTSTPTDLVVDVNAAVAPPIPR